LSQSAAATPWRFVGTDFKGLKEEVLLPRSEVEAYAVARIRDVPDGGFLCVGKPYCLKVGVLEEVPPELAFNIASVALPSLPEVVIEITVYAEDMDIEPSWVQEFVFRQGTESELLQFRLTPRKCGHKTIQVEFYHERHWLAMIQFDVEVVTVQEPVPA
jgi:hypothetical protein